ncbi:MAG: glycosyltransferase family 2 protein [Vicinamibacterales bacterium]
MDVQLTAIVIARNQASTIIRSLESIVRALAESGLQRTETIYVDSQSSDGSVALVRGHFGSSVRIVELTGRLNAAIARNAGADAARGKVLFFIDGDMEINAGFLRQAFDSNGELVHPVITGRLPEKVYDTMGRFLRDAPDRYRVQRRGFRAELGGTFLVDATVFRVLGPFASELRCAEDLDMGLRLAEAGYLTLALPADIALHHTVHYLDWKRLFSMATDGSMLYAGVLFRRHIRSRHYWKIFLSHQRATLVLLAAGALALTVHPGGLLVYVAYVVAKNLRGSGVSLLQDLVGTTARSLSFLAGLVFFHPRPSPSRMTSQSISGPAG